MGAGNTHTRVDKSIQDSILTTTHRKFLQSDISNTDRSTTTRSRIRERVREGLRDFRLLADHLEDRDREQIFDAKPRTQEYDQLQRDVRSAIAFMYAGLGGESGFRDPLRWGVAEGEVMLGNTDHPLDIEPRFTVNYFAQVDERAVIEAVESENWDQLSPRALFAFIRFAMYADAIDFERVYEGLDVHEEMVEWAESHNSDE